MRVGWVLTMADCGVIVVDEDSSWVRTEKVGWEGWEVHGP